MEHLCHRIFSDGGLYLSNSFLRVKCAEMFVLHRLPESKVVKHIKNALLSFNCNLRVSHQISEIKLMIVSSTDTRVLVRPNVGVFMAML